MFYWIQTLALSFYNGLKHLVEDSGLKHLVEALFLDLHLSFLDGFVSSKIYDKRDDFHVNMIVNFLF